MNRRLPLLALAFGGCIALSGCSQAESAFLHILLLLFGVPATFCALAGGVVALVRGVRRSRRSYVDLVNLVIAALFAVAAILLQLSVADGVGRNYDTLWLLVLSSSPLFWFAGAMVEAALAPPALPPDATGEPPPIPPLTAAKVAKAVVPAVVALVIYGVLLDHAVKLYHSPWHKGVGAVPGDPWHITRGRHV